MLLRIVPDGCVYVQDGILDHDDDANNLDGLPAVRAHVSRVSLARTTPRAFMRYMRRGVAGTNSSDKQLQIEAKDSLSGALLPPLKRTSSRNRKSDTAESSHNALCTYEIGHTCCLHLLILQGKNKVASARIFTVPVSAFVKEYTEMVNLADSGFNLIC